MRRLSSYGPSIVVLLTAIIVLAAGPNAIHRLSHAHTMARVYEASKRLQDGTILEQINQAYRDIATAVEPSVVHISASRQTLSGAGQSSRNARLSTGSGWIYDELGHVITNFHVIDQADRIDVQLYSGEIRSAEVIGADRSTDIAVLKIPSGRLHPAVRVEPGRDIQRGDMVFAFGSPFDFRFSMSSGVVSGMGRSVGVIRDPFVGGGYENFIQVDAAIHPGNSGGPLTDFRGHVIGMNTAIATSAQRARGDEAHASSIGLAIPIDMIDPVVRQLIETGEVQKGFLGVHVVDRAMRIGEEYAAIGYHGPGLVIAAIQSAEREIFPELQHGDVLAQVDGRQVRSREELTSVIRTLDLNGEVELTIWRYEPQRGRGRYQRIAVDADAVISDLYVLELVEFDEAVSTRLSMIGFHEQGVVVGEVDHDRPARQAGIQRGDVITRVNGRPVAKLEQLRSMISSMMPGDEAQLTIWRYDPEHNLGTLNEFTVPLARLDLHQAHLPVPRLTPRDAIEQLGIARMETMTESLAADYNLEYRPGVLVRAIVPNSPVAQKIRQGSVIVTVRDAQITSAEEFEEALRDANLRTGVRVGIVDPDNNSAAVILRLP